MAYNVTTIANGNGNITYTRSGEDNNTITVTASVQTHFHFIKFEIQGHFDFLLENQNSYIVSESSSRVIIEQKDLEITDNPLTIIANQDLVITGYFSEDPKWHISAIADVPHASVYVSLNDQYEPYTTTLWARPLPNYSFYRWSDGSYENPRSIYVEDNMSIVAMYKHAVESNGIYQYHCYIKDQTALTDLPKAYMKAYSFDTRVDLMTRANSNIYVYDAPESIENGDVLVLYDPKGTSIYNGVVKSIEKMNEHEKKITCSQMQSFYKGQWVYEKGESPPSSYNNSWYFEKYPEIGSTYPHIDDVDALSPVSTATYNDNNTSPINIGDNYTARATTYVWCSKPTIANVTAYTDDNGSIYINNRLVADLESCQQTMVELPLVKGMNKLVVLYTEKTGGDGWKVFLNYQSFPPYDSTKTYKVGQYVGYSEAIYQCKTAITSPEKWNAAHWNAVTAELKLPVLPDVLGLNSVKATDVVLERCIKNIVEYYASGHIVGSDYVDQLVASRLTGITVQCIESTVNVNLPTYDVGETMDFEDFIYYLYERYGIIFEFTINIQGPNYVMIRVPNYEPIKVGDNIFAITELNPVTTTEETNRLIIFAGDEVTYRATWVATETGIYESTASDLSRMKLTNTKIVFSDDPISDVVANNLPTQMYNHHLSFTLIIKNFVYEFEQFKLGGPLDVYTVTDYYDTVLTGYEIHKDMNENIGSVNFTCGKVRQKLTQLLTLKKI